MVYLTSILIAEVYICAFLALFVLLRLGRTRANNLFAVQMLLTALWAGGLYVELYFTDMTARIVFSQVKFVSSLFIPINWLAMMKTLTGQPRWMRGWGWWMIAAIPLAGLVLAAASPWLQLQRYDFQPVVYKGLNILVYSRGPLDMPILVWANLLGVLNVINNGHLWLKSKGVIRRQMALLFWAYTIPTAISVLYVMGVSMLPGINTLPFISLITVLIISWALFGYRFLDVMPVARDMLIEKAPEPVFVITQKSMLSYANQAAIDKLGIKQEMVGCSVDCLPSAVRELFAGNKQNNGYIISWGDTFFEMSVARVINDQNYFLGHAYTFRDVTQRVNSERRAHREQETLRIVFENMSEGIVLHDRNGRIFDVNQAAVKMLGASSREILLKMNLLQQFSTGTEASRLMRQNWDEAMDTGLVVVPCRTIKRLDSGEELAVRLVIQRVERENGVVLMATITDITAQLEQQRVRAEALRLNEEKRYQQQREHMIRDIHDGVGGIVANISMLAMLGQQVPSETEKNQKMADIQQSALEGSLEIRSLMSNLEEREIIWGELIVQVRRYAEMMLGQRDIELVSQLNGEPPDDLLCIPCAMSLFRIVKEAIHNILKHAQCRKVTLEMTFDGNQFTLAIHDDGKGFDKESVRHGRGLANMQKRADELGGELTVQSQDGVLIILKAQLPICSTA